MKKPMSTREAAKALGVSRQRMQVLLATNRLPAVQLYPGGPYLINPKDLERVRVRKAGRPRKEKPCDPD